MRHRPPMPLWMQHLLAVSIAVACGALVAWRLWRTLRTGQGGAGNCCARGCAGAKSSTTERIVFLPAEMLTRRSAGRRT
jgi:hypothetical protein